MAYRFKIGQKVKAKIPQNYLFHHFKEDEIVEIISEEQIAIFDRYVQVKRFKNGYKCSNGKFTQCVLEEDLEEV